MGRESRRDEILEKAAALFAQKGFRATTVRDIADEVGLLSGSLYAHIHSKEELYLEIVRRAAGEFTDAVSPYTRGYEPIQAIRQMVVSHLGVIERSYVWAHVYLDDDSQLTETTRMVARSLRHQYETLWDRVITEGKAAHQFRVSDVGMTRLFLLSALNGVSRWYRPNGRLSGHEVSQLYLDLALRVLGAFDIPNDTGIEC